MIISSSESRLAYSFLRDSQSGSGFANLDSVPRRLIGIVKEIFLMFLVLVKIQSGRTFSPEESIKSSNKVKKVSVPDPNGPKNSCSGPTKPVRTRREKERRPEGVWIRNCHLRVVWTRNCKLRVVWIRNCNLRVVWTRHCNPRVVWTRNCHLRVVWIRNCNLRVVWMDSSILCGWRTRQMASSTNIWSVCLLIWSFW
jgi:hypothetical protein